MQQFYDAVDIAQIPAEVDYAALYADGRFAVKPTDDYRRFTHRRWITVTGMSARIGIADYEPLNPVYDEPGKLRQWAVNRLHYAGEPPITYSDMTDLHGAERELWKLPRLYWVATRGHGQLTADELHELILSTVNLDIPVAMLWGNQFTDPGPYDISDLYGNWYL